MVTGWHDKTPEDFVLSYKGNRVATHRKKLRNVADYLNKFYNRMSLAGDKRGVILWQLSSWIKRDDDLLENFPNEFRWEIPAVEFRHQSWFEPDVYELLESYDPALCIISTHDLPLQVETTASFAYIHWHGSKEWYSSLYTRHELQRWADIILNLAVQDVYGYFNNDYNAYAPQNCQLLQRLLR